MVVFSCPPGKLPLDSTAQLIPLCCLVLLLSKQFTLAGSPGSAKAAAAKHCVELFFLKLCGVVCGQVRSGWVFNSFQAEIVVAYAKETTFEVSSTICLMCQSIGNAVFWKSLVLL